MDDRVEFELLFDGDGGNEDGGNDLTPAATAVYGGHWTIDADDRTPYVYVNFVMSRDARISFAEPGARNAHKISQGNVNDLWLMGLLRARADAVLIGDASVNVDPQYWATAAHIYPPGKELFAEQRRSDGRRNVPLQVILTQTGEIPETADVITGAGDGELDVLLVTGRRGETAARRKAGRNDRCEVAVYGEDLVDTAEMLRDLQARYGVRTLLCEGGPHVYGSLLRQGLVDDEFVCIAPILVGQETGRRRPSLVEGIAFDPTSPPYGSLTGVRRAGDFLFLRWSRNRTTEAGRRTEHA